MAAFTRGQGGLAKIQKRLYVFLSGFFLIAPIPFGMAITVRTDIEIYNTLTIVYISLFALLQSINVIYLGYVASSTEQLIRLARAQVAGMVKKSDRESHDAQLLNRFKYFRMAMNGTASSFLPLPVLLPAVYLSLGSFPFIYVLAFAIFFTTALIITPSLMYLLFVQYRPTATHLKSSRLSQKSRAHAALAQ
jgi:hypothetical protein